MKTIFVVFFIALLIFMGCSDDNFIQNQSNDCDTTLVYAYDSSGIVTIKFGVLNLNEGLNHIIPSEYKKLKIEFTCYTNLDSNCSMSIYSALLYESNPFFEYTLTTKESINRNHSIIVSDIREFPTINFQTNIFYVTPDFPATALIRN